MEIIQNKGFDPENFRAQEAKVDGRHSFVVTFKNSPLRFVARNADTSYHDFDCKHTSFGPGHSETEYFPDNEWTNIHDIYSQFEEWLEKAVKVYMGELLVPDLWMHLEQQKPLIGGSMLDKDETSPFSDEEKVQLRLAVREFESLVSKTFQAPQEQMQVIENRLDYLAKAANRLNRIDWRGLALSTIISISIALSLDTEQGRVLLNLFKQVFSKILYLLE